MSPGGADGRVDALVRLSCARALSLWPLPAEVEVGAPESTAETAAVDFAEQFSIDVSAIGEQQRADFVSAVGEAAFRTVIFMYVADFAPRVLAGLGALGISESLWGSIGWDHATDPADAVFNRFLPAVARMRALDPVTSEVARLRGATQHSCRLCKSLRESSALDAGGSESLYTDIERYDASVLLTARHKAALRYVDALIWSPSKIAPDVVDGVRAYFTDAEAVELTLDVMRNASNKIAVALAADAPYVEHGTERYLIDDDGQTVFSR